MPAMPAVDTPPLPTCADTCWPIWVDRMPELRQGFLLLGLASVLGPYIQDSSVRMWPYV